jgi:hypothetical protein
MPFGRSRMICFFFTQPTLQTRTIGQGRIDSELGTWVFVPHLHVTSRPAKRALTFRVIPHPGAEHGNLKYSSSSAPPRSD